MNISCPIVRRHDSLAQVAEKTGEIAAMAVLSESETMSGDEVVSFKAAKNKGVPLEFDM